MRILIPNWQPCNPLLADDVEFLPPVALGESLPEAEAVVFPQFLGEAYRQVENFKNIDIPILIITSEFGTLSMWDWEIASYLKSEGVETIAPYNLAQTKKICRGLAVKRELQQTKFLVFQDNPGEGFQASIFKRFYWWEDECTQRMMDKFGITLVKKSFKSFGAESGRDSRYGCRSCPEKMALQNSGRISKGTQQRLENVHSSQAGTRHRREHPKRGHELSE